MFKKKSISYLILLLLSCVAMTVHAKTNNDQQIKGGVSMSISDVTQVEGAAGTSSFIFDVTISSSINIAVNYATVDGTAQAGIDYIATSGTLSFTAGGSTTETITVVVIGDDMVESNDTFFVDLLFPDGPITITDGQGMGTIINDDLAQVNQVPTVGFYGLIILVLFMFMLGIKNNRI